MKAGFSSIDVTPPLGTLMMGTCAAADRPAQSVLDPIYLRALYLEHGDQRVLIVGFDLCFLGREGSDRLKTVLGRATGLHERQILLNATHNHAGPMMGLYFDLFYLPPDWDYLRQLDRAIVQAAEQAMRGAVDVSLHVGKGESNLSISRRLPRNGTTANAPNPDGLVYRTLPVCLMRDAGGKPVCLLFVGTGHPTAMQGPHLTADFPGAAMDALDKHLGVACSLFIAGPGGDSRPRNLVGAGAGTSADGADFHKDWDFSDAPRKIAQAGQTLADEVIALLGNGLRETRPALDSALVETHWPLQPPDRAGYESILAKPVSDTNNLDVHRRWARRQLDLMRRGQHQTTAPVLVQGIQLADDARIIAIEGEPVSAYGYQVERAFASGITFVAGYSNGDALYLVTSPMLDQGGYEPGSYWEYDFPSPLDKGMERVLDEGLAELKRQRIR